MTFLNAILLGGLATGAVPLAIHLLHRSRARQVRWGAMQFLRVSAKENRRRPRIEELLLLLLRILVPMALALCMARPVLEKVRSAMGGGSRVSMVLVVDDTASMAIARGGQRMIEEARARAVRVVRGLPRGSDVAVILPSDPENPFVAPTLDLQGAVRRLETLTFSASDAPLAGAVDAAVTVGTRMMHGMRLVTVLSDFQRASWAAEDAAERARVAERARALPVAPTILSMPVGGGEFDNLAVEALDFTALPVPVGRKVQFKASLKAFGKKGFGSAKVIWKVDGVERFTDTVQVEAGQRSQSAFAVEFDRAGSHRVEVVTDADTMVADNQRFASIRVVDPIPVLLVNGEPSNEPLQGETDFLEIALLAQTGAVKGPRLFDVTVARLEGLTGKQVASSTVVVLTNVRHADSIRREMEERVMSGAGLLVFPGDKIDLNWYRDHAHRGGKGWLPMAYREVRGGTAGGGVTMTVADQRMTHPAFAMFDASDVFRGGHLRMWHRLAGLEDALPEGVSVPLRLEDGSPLLVERAFGDGVVIQAAFPADADWGNFPMRPFYVPMMQQVVAYLASGVMPPLNLKVGQSLTVATMGDVLKRADKRYVPLMAVADPSGAREEMVAGRRGLRWVGASKPRLSPGFHVATVDGGEPIFYSVNGGVRESDPERLDDVQIRQVASELGGEIVEDAAGVDAVVRRSAAGLEIWKPLLALLLVLLFAELYMLGRFEARKEVAR
jgi:hypothetical protein